MPSVVQVQPSFGKPTVQHSPTFGHHGDTEHRPLGAASNPGIARALPVQHAKRPARHAQYWYSPVSDVYAQRWPGRKSAPHASPERGGAVLGHAATQPAHVHVDAAVHDALAQNPRSQVALTSVHVSGRTLQTRPSVKQAVPGAGSTFGHAGAHAA